MLLHVLFTYIAIDERGMQEISKIHATPTSSVNACLCTVKMYTPSPQMQA